MALRRFDGEGPEVATGRRTRLYLVHDFVGDEAAQLRFRKANLSASLELQVDGGALGSTRTPP